MRVALIGMMGTGKTAIGPLVAEKLGLSYADIDNCLVARIGMTIPVAFITFGEKTFHAYEHDVMCEVSWRDDMLICCGGGAALYEENMELLKDYVIVRLTATPEVIYDRTKDDFSRPLLKDNSPKKIAEMIDAREEAYARHADITLDTSDIAVEDAAQTVADAVMQFLENNK